MSCSPRTVKLVDTAPPEVSVARPIMNRFVTDYEEFLATTDAAEMIEVRSRVTGYLVECKFRPGQDVKKNDPLFVIDPRPLAAALKKAEADVKVARADLKLSTTELKRIARLLQARPPAASQEDRDKAMAQEEANQAKLEALEAVRDQAKINLDFTEIKADVDGIIGRNLITLGNLVNADQTLLTTIVKKDPIFAYFDVDQRTIERFRKRNQSDQEFHNDDPNLPVELGLEEDGDQFPYIGRLVFVDNRLKSNTGALPIRGEFYRKDLKPKQDALRAGFTARVRVPAGAPIKPILIPDRAIGIDQSQKYVYIVNSENKIEYRKVVLGNQYDDGLRAITNGLDGNEWVVVNGRQRVRPGLTVAPEQVDPITEKVITTK